MKDGDEVQNSIQDLRKQNKEKILKVLYELKQSQKNQLVQKTSLSSGTCFNILQELIDSGEVVVNSQFESTGGRKAKRYELNKNYCKILTVSLFREYEQIYETLKVYCYNNELVHEKTTQPPKLEFQDLCQSIDTMVEMFHDIQVICMAIPGALNKDGYLQDVFLVRGLEGFEGISIQRELEERYQIPVIIDNDVNIATKGYYAQHQEYSHMALIYQPLKELSGAAVLQNGQICKGTHGMVGELSFLSFLSKQEQFDCLKTQEGTVYLLMTFIVTLIVTVDPEVIVISCPWIEDSQQLIEMMKTKIPEFHIKPQIVVIEGIQEYMDQGLLELSHEFLRRRI